jgi:hypothetical protein|tara:strand:- start:626 stop:781 length:156 start_codon:yes stop_codon:yes gene_type:complete
VGSNPTPSAKFNNMGFDYILEVNTTHLEYEIYLTEDDITSINFENYSTTFG